MAAGPLRQVLSHIRKLVGEQGVTAGNDGALLERFIARGDQEAFAALLQRHGPMVLGVCRRMLGDATLADDAFQATFLVLVRKARSIVPRERVGNWLYGVAVRLSLKSRATAAQRRERPQEIHDVPTPDTTSAVVWRDLQGVLDHEIERLPDKYREPFVLTYIQGKTSTEVARELGCPEGTVFGRLARARERLRFRLERRGIALSAAALTALLAEQPLSAAVSPVLSEATLQAASAGAAGNLLAGVSAPAAGLVKGAIHDMFVKRLKFAALVVLAVGLFGAGTALGLHLALTPKGLPGPERSAAAELPRAVAEPLEDPLPPGAIARLGTSRFRHDNPLCSVECSLDGKRIAGADVHGRISVWEAQTGKRVARLDARPKQGFMQRVVLFPDGKTIACEVMGAVRVLDLESGKELYEVTGSLPDPGVQATSPDGRFLLTYGSEWIIPDPKQPARFGGKRGEEKNRGEQVAANADQPAPPKHKVRLWDARTGKELRTLADQRLPVAFTPDGKTLATRGPDMTIHLWDPATGKETAKLTLEGGNSISALAFSPDGKRLALQVVDAVTGINPLGFSLNSFALQVWDVTPGKKLYQPVERGKLNGSSRNRFTHLSFSPDGTGLWSIIPGEPTARLFDVDTGKERGRIDGIRSPMAVSPDGKTVISWAARRIQLWETATGKERMLMPNAHQEDVRSLAFAPDGRLASSFADTTGVNLRCTVCIWDPRKGELLHRLNTPDQSWDPHGPPLAFSPDGKVLVMGSFTLSFFDGATGNDLERLNLPNQCSSLAFTPDGRKIVWACNKIHVVDALARKELRRYPEGRQLASTDYNSVAISPDGKLVAAGHIDTSAVIAKKPAACAVEIRELDSGNLLETIPTKNNNAFQVAFVSDGNGLLFREDTIRLWDRQGKKDAYELTGSCFAVSPDEKLLAVGGEDGFIRLHDLASGKELRKVPGHLTRVSALAFMRDGKALASGSTDSTIVLWNVAELKP
jgi:RNA polymerase sigma factor (sigma-70 family)